MENSPISVNDFEIVKIDVLEARDYVDRVPDVNFVFIHRKDVDFRLFYESDQIIRESSITVVIVGN